MVSPGGGAHAPSSLADYPRSGWHPPEQRSMPARSFRESMPVNPASRRSAHTAPDWSQPCSSSSQPPCASWAGAAATIPRRSSRPSTPDASACRGSCASAARCPSSARHRADCPRPGRRRRRSLRASRPAAAQPAMQPLRVVAATSRASELRSTPSTCASGRAAQRQRDRAAAGAEVDDPRRRPALQRLQRPLDQGFGLRPRHQHARVDVQRQPEELLAAGQVGHRLALGAALHRPRKPCCAGDGSACRHGRSARRARSAAAPARAAAADCGVEPRQAAAPPGRSACRRFSGRRPHADLELLELFGLACQQQAFTTSSRSPSMWPACTASG